MRHRFQPLSRLAVASFAWLAVARAHAQLTTSSPFLPVKAAASPTAPTAGAPLEFRGQIDIPEEGMKLRIYDPGRKAGAWLKVNEKDPVLGFVVKQYDRARGTVSVEYNGQTFVLAQREAKVTSLGAASLNIPMGAIPLPSSVTQSVVPNPTPADEQRRLEAVAQEVARRRQLREQATEQLNPNAAAPPPAAPNNVQPGAAGRGRTP